MNCISQRSMTVLAATQGGRAILAVFGVMLLGAGVASCEHLAKPVAEDAGGTSRLERSFWIHASLGLLTQRNYFGPDFPATAMPEQAQVERAARLLTTTYAANRLYLIYHREVPLGEARALFRSWRRACPQAVEIVPALVLRMYDRGMTQVFAADELAAFAGFLRDAINARHMAVYDIAAHRDLGDATAVLLPMFPAGLIRLGLQPGEALDAPFASAVADTWSAMCHGTRTSEDWLQPGFGAGTLRQWVNDRNSGHLPVAWNLVTVAWDYSSTLRGGYPGYDDAEKNMALPAGRNRAAMQVMRDTAKPRQLAGFSSDLYILHENSRAAPHDGKANSFYECLKRGEDYRGYYATPFHEIVALFTEMRSRKE